MAAGLTGAYAETIPNFEVLTLVVFCSGVLFLLISIFPIREYIINAVSKNLKLAISAGIGLFLGVIALEKTGKSQLWQTPLVVGAFGLLASPSRGLLVFSPFLVLAFWGLPRLWKEPAYAPLRRRIFRPLRKSEQRLAHRDIRLVAVLLEEQPLIG